MTRILVCGPYTFLMVLLCRPQLMNLVASTLFDLVKNLRAFAGILVVSVVPRSASSFLFCCWRP